MAERKRGPKPKFAPTPLRSAVPDPPGHLPLAGKERWHAVARLMERAGILSELDQFALEQYCAIYARWIEAQKELNKGKVVVRGPRGGMNRNRWYEVARECQKDMKFFLDRFGLTPASRTRLDVQDADDPGAREWKELGVG